MSSSAGLSRASCRRVCKEHIVSRLGGVGRVATRTDVPANNGSTAARRRPASSENSDPHALARYTTLPV